MKYIFKNLKSFIKNDIIIFLVAFVSLFVSSMVLLFSYGLYNNFNNEKKEIEVFPETIVGTGTEQLTKSSLIDFLLSIDSEIIDQTDMFYCSAHIEPYNNDLGFRFSLSGKDIVNADSFVKNFNSNLKNSGRYFSDEEMSQGSKVAVIYSEPHSKENISEPFITIDNEKYEVIGTTWFSNEPIIPFTSLKDNVKIDYIDILPKTSVTRNMFYEYYNKSNGIIEFEQPQINDVSDIALNNNLIMMSVLISIISGVNYASLYKYILLKRKKELAVFRLCGCSLMRVIVIYLAECFFITTSVYIFSGLFFDIYLKKVISEVLENINEMYSMKIYILIYIIYITVSIILLFIAIYRATKVQIKNLVSEE